MLKYKRPDNFYPNIARLESKQTEIRTKELQHAQESLNFMTAQDNIKPSFVSDFIEGFTLPFEKIYDVGHNLIISTDKVLNAGGDVISSFHWILEHPIISFSSVLLIYVLIKKI